MMKPLFNYTKCIAAALLIMLMATACSSSKKSTSSIAVLPALQPEPESKTGKIKDAVLFEKKITAKYAAYINQPVESIENVGLFIFIDKWLYTPYKYGGTTQQGVDCSGFVQRLLTDVYGLKIIRKSSAQFYKENTDHYNSHHVLNEGDVLFFQTGSGKEITHMGLYVGNRMFVHAASSIGVSIANMDNSYWQPRYAGAGRVIAEKK